MGPGSWAPCECRPVWNGFLCCANAHFSVAFECKVCMLFVLFSAELDSVSSLFGRIGCFFDIRYVTTSLQRSAVGQFRGKRTGGFSRQHDRTTRPGLKPRPRGAVRHGGISCRTGDPNIRVVIIPAGKKCQVGGRTPWPIWYYALMMEVRGADLLPRMRFVGRDQELARLRTRLDALQSGSGSVVMLVGEPGIGKTRTVEEFAKYARGGGATVLWGRCYVGEAAPPYGPFAEAIAEYARSADPDALRADLGYGGPPTARLVPALREKLPDIEEPAKLQPDEERFRLLDAVAQFLIATSQRAPLILVLDDLHWADRGTLAMMLQVARFTSQQRILILGAYRDVEPEAQERLSDALAQLRAVTVLESVPLGGLAQDEVSSLVAAVAEQNLPEGYVSAISRGTAGNPFFIREVLLHLVDSGALYQRRGEWKIDAALIEEIGIPGGVREAVERRLSRLSADACALLTAASAFDTSFSFAVAFATAKQSEGQALSALDEALAAQLLRVVSGPETYEFTHALVRDALYTGLSPSRQVRLHRQIAEALEDAYDASEHAAETAHHYHRSRSLPGEERGVEYAITAAGRAEAMYAYESAAVFLQMALDLLPNAARRVPGLLKRLAVALALSSEYEGAVEAACCAADLVALGEGNDSATGYLADTASLLFDVGFQQGAWKLAAKGLQLIGETRGVTWARLMVWEVQRRDADDVEGLGIPTGSPEAAEAALLLASIPYERMRLFWAPSREHVLAFYGDEPQALMSWAGEYRRALAMFLHRGEQSERQGQIGKAVNEWSSVVYCYVALGKLELAGEAFARLTALAARLPGSTMHSLRPVVARAVIEAMTDPLNAKSLALFESLLTGTPAEYQFAFAAIRATFSMGCAIQGREADALRWLHTLLPAIERAPGFAPYYPGLVCNAASSIWLLGSTEHIEVIERNLRTKMLAPDFRMPVQDARLSLARLCALQGRHAEAIEWFQKAREVLDEQGARPLRALVDYDEALMYVRRGRRGDRVRALPLVEAALAQFREIGMTGWVRLAEELRRGIDEKTAGVAIHPDGMTPREVDVLRLIAAGRTNKEVASDLTLSVRTVGRHITNIYGKTGLRNKGEASVYARQHGLI